ncbi:S-formylglutathione hydrolase FrmB [Actinacidiphila yanglinensis]|uniref:S-formylglutathione hydrolase FrmB n=1 Tax=Actinacidiphila yanglinensis TaxID=310779 RepID=A0A1H6E830_9ACTN|nr:alpha/beta hydrolase family protein [Actinacidiphila yanglinensis]SEG93978.1 S-formylglutathione hydrolase FrmB [Actinacidiphila yanglinensis]
MSLLTLFAVTGAPSGNATTGPGILVTRDSSVRSDSGAYVSAVRQVAPHVLDLDVYSPAMGGEEPVRVILPSAWSPYSRRTFPTLYLLQGASDDYTSWTRETDVETLAARADVIVVMPEGGRAGFYTNWWNHGRPGGPKWETFHTAELVQIMERGYRANTRRAVIGLSEGGLGALDYTARHRGEYVFAGSFSGVVDLDDRALRAGIAATCLREGVNPDLLWGDYVHNRGVWESHNPAHLVSAFRGVKVYLSAAAGLPGPLDANSPLEAGMLEAPTYLPTGRLADAMRRAGIDVTAHLYLSGTHTWPYWQRELHLAWPSVLHALRVAR